MKLDTTKYAAMVANAAARVKISSTVFKNFIADVKSVIDGNDDELQSHKSSNTAHGLTRNLDTFGFVQIGGLIIQWGKVIASNVPGTPLTSDLNIPFPSQFVSVVVSANASQTASAVTVQAHPTGLDKITYYSTVANQDMYYIAIGF